MSRVLYLATMNAHKVQELAAIIGPRLTVKAASAVDPALAWDETGTSFVENARIKAHAVLGALRQRGLDKEAWVLADDSGLSVDALGGEPGIHSARYAGPGAKDKDNNAKLCAELEKLGGEGDLFRARFTCALYFIDHMGREQSFVGTCEGAVTLAGRGAHGFGYDPLFVVDGYGGRTLAELAENTKNQISHRRKALDQWLASW